MAVRVITKVCDGKLELSRMNPGPNIYAISHRWTPRNGTKTFTVKCQGEADYPCQLADDEAQCLAQYIKDFKYIWCDYVCVNQTSDADKNVEIPKMGTLYEKSTSLIVGHHLSAKLPPADYLERCWTLQERHFGPIKFAANLQKESPGVLAPLAVDLLNRIPGVDVVTSFIGDGRDKSYDSRESWRIDSLRGAKKTYPQAAAVIDKLINAVQSGKHSQLPAIGMEARELIKCEHKVSGVLEIRWAAQMYNMEAAVKKDALFGCWSVPMAQVGVTNLPYNNPGQAFQMVCDKYPGAKFALLTTKTGRPKVSFNGGTTLQQAAEMVLEEKVKTPPGDIKWTGFKKSPYYSGSALVWVFNNKGEVALGWESKELNDALNSKNQAGISKGPFFCFLSPSGLKAGGGGDRWENSIVEGLFYACIECRGKAENKGSKNDWRLPFEAVKHFSAGSPNNL